VHVAAIDAASCRSILARSMETTPRWTSSGKPSPASRGDHDEARKHLYLMVGLVVLAVVLLFTGTAGGGLVLVGACAVMMVFMMRGMGGGQHGGDRHDETEDLSGRDADPRQP
jgi:hypothetical protein